MRKVKRFGIILGILLIATILLCGSAVAPWTVSTSGSTNCTNPDNALGASGTSGDATVGQNPSTLGVLMLDLGSGNEMGADQLFTVYGYISINNINETYNITIYVDDDLRVSYGPYNGWDSEELEFTTPLSPPDPEWRYIEITGRSGQTYFENQYDTIYGPEIDAVGWT